MKAQLIFFVLLLSVNSVHAGSLINGSWTPSHCNQKPDAPVINDQNVEIFNKSVAAINQWQQQSKSYYECLINEANADNNIIANSANQAQRTFHDAVEKMSKEVDSAKKKLENK